MVREFTSSAGSRLLALDRRDALMLGGALLFLLVLFGGVLFSPTPNVVGRPRGDGRTQFYVWRVYGFERVAEGGFPLWNPYTFAGMPFVANLQSAMFYPPNWLFAFMPPWRAANLSVVFNLFLSLAFAYAWGLSLGLRRVPAMVVGAVYTFGGFQFLRVYEGHWCHLAAMAWIPWMMLCAEGVARGRRVWLWAALGAAGLALQVFAGHPQYLFYSSIAVCVYFVARLFTTYPVRTLKTAHAARPTLVRLLAFAAIFPLGVTMSAVQMLPALELLGVSARRGQLTLDWVSQYSLAPENLLTLIVPRLYGIGPGVAYWGRWNAWEMGCHIGAAGFALALVGAVAGRKSLRRMALGLAALLGIFALGGYTPLLRLLFHLPGFGLFRGLVRFMAPAGLFIALLTGLGADALFYGNSQRARRSLRILAVLTGILLVLGAATWRPGDTAPGFWRGFVDASLRMGDRPPSYHEAAMLASADFAARAYATAWFSLAMVAGFTVALAVLAALRRKGGAVGQAAPLAVLALLGADAAIHSSPYLVTFDGRDLAWSSATVEFLRSRSEPFRVTQGDLFGKGPLDPLAYRVASLEGIEPNVPARFRDIFWKALEEPTTTQRTSYHMGKPSRNLNLLRLLNWRFIVDEADRPTIDIEGTRQAFKDAEAGIRVDELPGWLPRARLVHHAIIEPDADRLLEMLVGMRYELAAMLEKPLDAPLEAPSRPDPPPVFTRYEPERIEIQVSASAPGLLVLSDLYYPGWKARVNGEPAEIVRADYVCRAVALPAGEHTVEFTYEPASFALGAWVSGLSWLGVGGWIAHAMLQSKRRKRQPAE